MKYAESQPALAHLSDDRLGFGLYLSWVMSLPRRPEPLVVDRQNVGGGMLGILSFCREHRLTGVA